MDDTIQQVGNFLNLGERNIYRIIASIAIAVCLFIINRLLRRIVGKFGTEPKSAFRGQKVIGYATGILAVLLISGVWFESIDSLTTFLGLLSAGIAIALKDIIEDIAGWMFIVMRKPFTLEDRVETRSIKGDVIDIRLFTTTLLEIGNWVDSDQSTGRIVHIPNKTVLSEPITNYSKGFQYIWNELKVLITFESDWERAKSLLSDIVKRYGEPPQADTKKALKEASGRFLISYNVMTPTVYTSVKDSGILLTLRYLCRPRERRQTEQAIWEDTLRAFAVEERIAFAYPTTRFYYEGEQGRTQEQKDPPHPL